MSGKKRPQLDESNCERFLLVTGCLLWRLCPSAGRPAAFGCWIEACRQIGRSGDNSGIQCGSQRNDRRKNQQLLLGLANVPRRLRNDVLLEVATELIMPVIRAELTADANVPPETDLDFLLIC